MPLPTVSVRALCWLSVIAVSAPVFAQPVVAPVPVPPKVAEEKSVPAEAVVLSPFEVSTEKDNGFAASGSLAGGRLASELRDTPVAYSVITREFIDALGITDLQSAAEWATSSTLNVDNGQQNFLTRRSILRSAV